MQRIVSREYWAVTIRTVEIKTARRVQRVEKGTLGRIFDPLNPKAEQLMGVFFLSPVAGPVSVLYRTYMSEAQ